MTEKKQAKSQKPLEIEQELVKSADDKPIMVESHRACASNKKCCGGGVLFILILLIAYLSMPLWYLRLPANWQSEKVAAYFFDFSKLSLANSKDIAEMQKSRSKDDVAYQISELSKAMAENSRAIFAIQQDDSKDKQISLLTNSLNDLQNKINALTAQMPSPKTIADLQGKVLENEKKIESLKPQKEETALKLLSVISLREKVFQGLGYSAELSEVNALFANNDNVLNKLSFLKSEASKGIMTSAALEFELKKLAPFIVSEPAAFNKEDWAAKSLVKLKKVFLIRKTEVAGAAKQSQPDSVEALVAEAEAMANRNDLAGAVNALGKISNENAVMIFDKWMVEAELRLKADKVLSELTIDLIEELKTQNIK